MRRCVLGQDKLALPDLGFGCMALSLAYGTIPDEKD